MKKKPWQHVLRAVATAFSFFCSLLFCTLAFAKKVEVPYQASRPQAWGYQPWWMSANWPAIDLGLWQRAIFFELHVEADGSIGNIGALPPAWREMGRDAANCGSALDLAFTLFDEQKFEKLFASSAARKTLLNEILALTKAANAMGVHLDFEIYKRVSDESIKGFREFLRQLSASLRQGSPSRIVSAFGVVGAAQDMFDKEALSKLDFIVIQGYDAHWIKGPVAGPVAPLKGSHHLTWEKSLQHYLKLGARRSRLLFSIPYFGYEWPVRSDARGSPTTGDGMEMTYAPVSPDWVPRISISAQDRIRRHGSMRDPETGSPYYAYRESDGSWKQGWYEDEESLAEKFAFVKRERLAGVAAFPLGYDAGKFDALLNAAFGKRPYCRAGERAGISGK